PLPPSSTLLSFLTLITHKPPTAEPFLKTLLIHSFPKSNSKAATMKRVLASGLTLLATAAAQQVGTEQAETHPSLNWSDCSSGSCQEVSASVVIDANWRWVHELDGYENCYDGNEWTDKCSSAEDCATNCAVEGADYQATYGITTS